jgi:hypothetical protein
VTTQSTTTPFSNTTSTLNATNGCCPNNNNENFDYIPVHVPRHFNIHHNRHDDHFYPCYNYNYLYYDDNYYNTYTTHHHHKLSHSKNYSPQL